MNTPIYDIAIIGAGCAGLSLCYYLSSLNINLKIVVIEQRNNYTDDKTWTFWHPNNIAHTHEDIISKRWGQWHFSQGSQKAEHHSQHYSYCLIKSIDYYKKMLSIINSDSRFNLVLNCQHDSLAYHSADKIYSIKTNHGIINAPLVINTIPDTDILKNSELQQVFYGCEVSTLEPIFNDKSIGLMTNMQSTTDYFEFTYIIPYSPSRALLEITQFSKSCKNPDDLKDKCLELITNLASPASIIRSEKGILPMGLKKHTNNNPTLNYFDMSQTSGTLRAASGYGFNRIHAKSQLLIQQLFKNDSHKYNIKPNQYGSYLTSYLDRIFLKVLSKQIELSPSLFMRMGTSIQSDNFAAFMSEDYSAKQLLNVVSAMPKLTFLRESLSWG